MSESVRVIYIAGYGRSGSTLLSRLLAAHPKVVSLGELVNFERTLSPGYKCGCKSLVSKCSFWGSLYSSSEHISLAIVQEYALSRAHYLGYSYIVDSSKTAYSSVQIPRKYEKMSRGLYLIHLKRSVTGVIISAGKGRNSDIEKDAGQKRNFEALRTLFGKSCADIVATLYRIKYRDSQRAVDFRNLLDNPSAVVRDICSDLGLELDPCNIDQLENPQFIDGHEIAGNRWVRE